MLNNFNRSISTRTVLIIAATGVGLKCLHFLFKLWHKHIDEKPEQRVCKIIFFPDKNVACRYHFTKRHGCTSPVCKFSHDAELSYAALLKAINSAKVSIELCIFCITADELGSILCELNRKGVAIRVITDSDQVHASGSQVSVLRKEGIQVRCDNTTFYMHHKFAIIDGRLLINGSFNWTRAAITGNFENLCITDYPNIVQPFITEFENLWKKFDPKIRQLTGKSVS